MTTGPSGGVLGLGGARVGERQQEGQVGGIEGGGLDPDEDPVWLRLRGLHRVDGDADLPVLGDEGAQLAGGGRYVAHAVDPVSQVMVTYGLIAEKAGVGCEETSLGWWMRSVPSS
jgi:hypothetical protein